MRSNFFLVALLLITLAVCVQGDDTHRSLRSSVTTQDAEAEERVDLKGAAGKFSSLVREKSGNVLEKYPSVAAMLGKNPALAKGMDKIIKNEKLVADLKKTKSFKDLRTAIRANPQAVDSAKAEQFGKIMVERLREIQWVGDTKGMAIVYSILFLTLLGIGGTGFYIYNNVKNSYIH
uniref:Avh263 n=1 Tax=Phytophthora sojae TaxID=67593 RepID=G1FSH9_PHYSO|nr:Avh263 [Phytophthora sojae]AEK81068.1 Avh263 [Phytophthora sojae]AEK81069.1 Avh263 [Phytophthora sojae]